MDDFDRDPLDLLDDDGDGVNEMCLLFDEDGKNKHGGNKPDGNSGCCAVFLIIGSSVSVGWWCVSNLFI